MKMKEETRTNRRLVTNATHSSLFVSSVPRDVLAELN